MQNDKGSYRGLYKIDRVGVVKYGGRKIVKNGGRMIDPVGSIGETILMFIDG